MKQRRMTQWTQSISWGVLAAILLLLAGTAITQAESPKKGQNYTVYLPGNVKLEMVWIKPGTFMMGSPEDELGRTDTDDEMQHKVTLTKGYWMGKYEVTQSQYKAIMKKNPVEDNDESYRANDPVYYVPWVDAMRFCVELTEREEAMGRLPDGYEYTLPTEAQWEYACRAGTTTALNNGKNLMDISECAYMDRVGWYKANAYNDDKPHSVGQKKPNNWGLYDMHGNVQEWCLDWHSYLEDQSTEAVTDPKGPSKGTEHIIRGGSWSHEAWFCRSAMRTHGHGSIMPWKNQGFRVVLSPEE